MSFVAPPVSEQTKEKRKKVREERKAYLEQEFVFVYQKGSKDTADDSKTWAQVRAVDHCQWKCLKATCNHHFWRTTLNSRLAGSGCPFCAHQKTCECEKTRRDKNSHLEKEFIFAFQKGSKDTADDSKTWAQVQVKDFCRWRCSAAKCDHHVWRAILESRLNGSGCPFCAKQQICECQTFATLASDKLRQEYNCDKNPLMTEISGINSHKKVWWRHEAECCGIIHEWETTINSRVQLGTNCPYCCPSPLKTCQCKSLRTLLSSKLLEEWDEARNLADKMSLDDLSVGSGKKAWWKCEKHGSWKTKIASRTGPSCGCPKCGSSKMELNMLALLQKLKEEGKIISMFHHFTLPTKPNRMYADFVVEFRTFDERLIAVCIEMDGQQHFFPVPFNNIGKEATKKEFIEIQKRDQHKDAYLTSVGRSCLRISYEVKSTDYEFVVLDFLAKAALSEKGFIQKVGDAYC